MLALRAPGRVRALITLDTPVRELRGGFRRAWCCALESPETLRAELRASLGDRVRAELRPELEGRLEQAPLRALCRAYASLPVSTDAAGREELALEAPAVPWLALQLASDAESPRPGSPRMALRSATPADPELLLKELAALVTAVPGAELR